MIREAVSDTGPIISFERIPDGFRVLQRLVDRLRIPASVLAELEAGGRPESRPYLDRHDLRSLIIEVADGDRLPHTHGLHVGEASAIAIAMSQRLPLLIEERRGRDVAAALGVPTIGAAGLIVVGARTGRITRPEAADALAALAERRRISSGLRDALLMKLSAP